MSDITELIRNFVVENFLFGNDEDLTNATSFLDEGIIDSTGVLELVSFLEETFALQIDDEDLIPENLDSIDKVTSYVERKRGVIAAA
jgi:acyl carrier protein